mmetsp:Transcript_6155/g.16355  ORF Transcript_6155/g.16355 Transcript_6155/m.16355 type:complete len:282 (-) Transcript_6155:425-1270(-)
MPRQRLRRRLRGRVDRAHRLGQRRGRRGGRDRARRPQGGVQHGEPCVLCRRVCGRPLRQRAVLGAEAPGQDSAVLRGLVEGRLWVQCRGLLDFDAAEHQAGLLLGLLLRREQRLRGVLRRGGPPGGEPLLLALHAARRGGQRRRRGGLRRGGAALERPARVGRPGLRAGGQVHRHAGALQRLRVLPGGLRRLPGGHAGNAVAGRAPLLAVPEPGQVQGHGRGLAGPRGGDDTRGELLEQRRDAVDGRAGERRPRAMREGRRRAVRRHRCILRLLRGRHREG